MSDPKRNEKYKAPTFFQLRGKIYLYEDQRSRKEEEIDR